ncbi:MAG: carboxypeptidase-like regulatory domain-containing protein [Thermoproteota archaeon]
MNHLGLKKTFSIATILVLILVVAPLAATAQQAYPPGEWKFKIVDNWGLWGSEAAKYDPVTGKFSAVAYLYNSSVPLGWPTDTPWTFENWPLLKWGEADANGWITIPELPGDAWDRAYLSTNEFNYTLVVKLKIGTTITPITIFNATILRIGKADPPALAVGLYDLIHDTLMNGGTHPDKPWVTGIVPDFITPDYAGFKVWLYYVAMQPMDELGFPMTGATLEVRYHSDYDGKTYIQNKPVDAWRNVLYGKWVTNGTMGSEFVVDPYYVYHANYHVGWVILRVPLINSTTASDLTYRSSLVNNMTFIWRYKTGTPIAVCKYYVLTAPEPPVDAWDPAYLIPAPTPAVGSYANYYGGGYWGPGSLRVNTTHYVSALVKWTQIALLDCNENPWFTMKAEVYAFDNADKNQFMLAATRVGPGQYLLRYPLPAPPFPNTTLTLGVEWYYSLVNVSERKVGYYVEDGLLDEMQYDQGYDELWWGVIIPDPDEAWWFLEYGKYLPVVCNMTWVDVNFWSAAELPQQPADFAAKIYLPSVIGFRKAEPLTVWWNGKNGFVVLPDMEWYTGPNKATFLQMDPWVFADYYGNFQTFYNYMSWLTGGFYYGDGNGWLPTREVGWVDFEAWYEGVKVLDTYAEGMSLKLPCCESYLPSGEGPGYTECHYNFTLKIYELGFHTIFESCGLKMDAPTGVPFFFSHPNPDLGLIGPKSVTSGKVDIVKAPTGNYSNFAIVWHMSLLRPYKILYLLDNGTTVELTEPIKLTGNMRNIQLYFKLWNLTIDTWSQDPFRLVNVDVTLYSESDFGIAPGLGITKRMLDQITDPSNIAYQHVLPPGWEIYDTGVDEYGFPVIYYHTDTQRNYAYEHPHWEYLPEKNYWILVTVPEDEAEALAAGFRAVDAGATLYWSGDPWNEPLYLDRCYGQSSPYRVDTYVYNPTIVLKTACGALLDFDETMNSALILAEPWDQGNRLYYMQQIDPSGLVTIGTPGGVMAAPYNAYLVRKNSTENGKVTLHSVNATPTGVTDDDLWNPTTGWVAKYYPEQSRYLIGYSPGSGPIEESSPKYRLMVYYKGVLVYNESRVFSNPYAGKENDLVTSVYPYVFRVTNDPLPGEGRQIFGIANIKVEVFWAGLNVTYWPTKHLTYETAPIEFSLLNASKLAKGFNMSVVKRLWGPAQVVITYLENIPYQPVPPYFSSMVVVESALTDSNGKARFLIPVWNYSVTPKIYTWTLDDAYVNFPNLYPYYCGPRNPWNKALGPLSINLLTAGATGRVGALFGTPVYANFTTVPGMTAGLIPGDTPKLVGVLEASTYGRWMIPDSDHWIHAMNATGLVNTATDTWEETRVEMTYIDGTKVYLDGVSLNTTYRAEYVGEWWAGVGMLSGGAYQHRAPDLEDGKTYSPPQPAANCYAKVDERLIVNDIGVVVRNLVKEGLPNQKVTITRDADGAVMMTDWTPTKPNADPKDYYILYLRSTPSNMLWGIYDFTVKTENLTRGMTNTLLKLNDPQFLVEKLEGEDVDWRSQIVYLDWPARLKVTILTEDGRPLEKAWVYVMDAYKRSNVTAAITDEYGHAGTLVVGAENAVPPLRIEPGDRVDIGFNLLRGWYWVDEDNMLTGIAVNKYWAMEPEPYGYEWPPQPIGDEYIQCGEWWPTPIDDGYPPIQLDEYECMRFYGKYYVVVYYKPAGCSEVQGPVFSSVVFDSYTDEDPHQYIYLGIHPEAIAPVSEYDPSQAKIFRAYVSDLRMSFTDSAGRPLTGVSVKAKHPIYGWESELAKAISVETNTATLGKVPLRPGTSYSVQVEWTSKYGTKATGTASITETETSISLPIYDITLRLLTPRGAPLVGVPVKVAGVDVGATSATGEVMVPQIPPGTYSVAASWLDTALNLPSLVVSAPGVMTLNPTNLHVLTVRVIGAQGQALEGATVKVTKGAVEVTRLTDKDGKAEIELPDASYNIDVSYGQFAKSDSVSLTTDTLKTVNLDVFIEFLGVGMSMAQFLLFIVMIIVIVLVLAIVIHEYHIYRRKKLPQLFGAPAGPK